MKRKCLVGIALLLGMICVRSVSAQDDRALLEKLIRDDSDVVNIIALYDDQVRIRLFEAASNGEIIARLSDIQRRSNDAFRKAISGYSKEEQSSIWNLTRYDGLLDKLTDGGRKDAAAVDAITANYPEDLRTDARNMSQRHPETLAAIAGIEKDFAQQTNSLLGSYPDKVQTTFKDLIHHPDALTLLNDNMRTCVLLGDLWKRDSKMVRERFSELNMQLVDRKAKDLAEWQETMQKDPDAKAEMEKSAADFASENGYKTTDNQLKQAPMIDNIHVVSYPYWSGYPYWYTTPCWYPYPYWYHCGYYYVGPRIHWWGPPSWLFLSWHFHHRGHFSMYPHITNCYFNYYYYGSHRYYTRGGHEVRRWFGVNRSNFPADFRENTVQRIDRIRGLSTTAVVPPAVGGRPSGEGGGRVRPGSTDAVGNGGRQRQAPAPDRPSGREVTPRPNPAFPSNPRTPESPRNRPDQPRPTPNNPQPRPSSPTPQPRPSSPTPQPRPSNPAPQPRQPRVEQPRVEQPHRETSRPRVAPSPPPAPKVQPAPREAPSAPRVSGPRN